MPTIRTLAGEPVNVKQLAKANGWSVLYLRRALDATPAPTSMDDVKASIVAQMAAPRPKFKQSPRSLRWNGHAPDLLDQHMLTNQAPTPVSRSIPPPRMSRHHSKDCA